VHDLVECSSRAGDIVQSDEIGAAMLSLRAFMFDRVYLAAVTRPEHDRARAAIGRIHAQLVERGDDEDQIVEFVAGMTDRFALSYAESL
jgi:dGTPase